MVLGSGIDLTGIVWIGDKAVDPYPCQVAIDLPAAIQKFCPRETLNRGGEEGFIFHLCPLGVETPGRTLQAVQRPGLTSW